jgi:hypothetical protein
MSLEASRHELSPISPLNPDTGHSCLSPAHLFPSLTIAGELELFSQVQLPHGLSPNLRRIVDARRSRYKIGTVHADEFGILKEKIRRLLA